MRSFLLLLVGLLLAGVGQSAFATTYVWSSGALYGYFSTKSLSCFDVAEQYVFVQRNQDTTVNATPYWYYYESGCGLGSVRAVGDMYTVAVRRVLAGQQLATGADLTLRAIVEDDVLDEVSNASLQRVLVMVGSALMFGLGMVVGKA